MGDKFKKYIKTFIIILELGLIYTLLSNVLLILSMEEKEINTVVKFLFENLFLIFTFIYNIKTWILLKSEDQKKLNSALITGSIFNLIYFMDKIVLNNYLEIFVFYAIAVIYMLFLLFKLGLIGEKHSMYHFETKKISKILIIITIFIILAGEIYYIYNTFQNINGIINIKENTKNNEGIIRLLNKEKIRLTVKTVIFLVSCIIIFISNKNNKYYNKINIVISLLLLIISIFSIKNTCAYYLGEIVFINVFVNNLLETKKKIEIE